MNIKRKVIFVDGSTEIVLPVTPASFSVGSGIQVETINIHALGDIHVAGYPTLAKITLNSFFPANVYSFASGTPDPYGYVQKFKALAFDKKVVRFIISGTDINIPVLISSIDAGEQDGSNDVYYTLSISEYRYTKAVEAAPTLAPVATRVISVAPVVQSTYVAKKHDTVKTISRAFGTKERLIANTMKYNPKLLKPGTRVTLKK